MGIFFTCKRNQFESIKVDSSEEIRCGKTCRGDIAWILDWKNKSTRSNKFENFD